MYSDPIYSNEGRCTASPAAAGEQVLPVQRRDLVGAVDDPLEAEADTVADQVMRMPDGPVAQRKCTECAQDDMELQRKPLAAAVTPFSQTAQRAGDSVQLSHRPDGGDHLPESTRSFMETRFGADFSNVRIHSDGAAARMSSTLEAQAFTAGNHIYFGAGRYVPESEEGRHLLAHELTHTLQQGSASAATRSLQRKLKLTGTDDATRQAFLKKMNEDSSVVFELEKDGTVKLKDPKAVGKDEYAKGMISAINDAQTVILNLITKSDTVFGDEFATGDVDAVDMTAMSSPIFRSHLLHFVVERFAIKDYEKNKASTTVADFKKAHGAGHEAQERFLKESFPKKTIKYIGEGFDNSTKTVDKSGNGTIDYYFDFTDIKYIFTQPIVSNATKENIVKAVIKIVR